METVAPSGIACREASVVSSSSVFCVSLFLLGEDVTQQIVDRREVVGQQLTF